VLAQEEVAVVEGGGVEGYQEFVWAGGGGGDGLDLEAGITSISYCSSILVEYLGLELKLTDNTPSLASPRFAGS
jgi:hypothetical protein